MKKHSPHFLSLVMKAKKNVKEIQPQELIKQMQTNKDFIVIDVREKDEWLQGHMPKAIHLSKGVIERDIEKTIPDLNTPITVYCSGGFRSVLVAHNLQKMGYTNIFSLKGGFNKFS